MEQSKNNLLEGNLWRQILLFALPIAITSMMQQLFNAADMAVVGRFASSQALAAVGTTTPAVNLCITMLTGLSIGANVRIAHAIGSGEMSRVKRSVDTAIALSIICGLAMALITEIIARPLLEILSTPENIIDDATVYLRIYFIGTIFLMVYNFTAAILRASGDSKSPLYCLIFTGVINLGLNLLFVIVFQMGVVGVALATLIANIVNAALLLGVLLKGNALVRLNVRDFSPNVQLGLDIFSVGLPAGLQGALFNVANLIVQAGLNSLGSDVVAASTIAINAEVFVYYLMSAFGQTTVTFVGQNIGAKNLQRCREVVRVALAWNVVLTMLMSLASWIWAASFSELFASDVAVIDIAVTRIRMVMLFEGFSALAEVASGALRGLGHANLPTIISAIFVCGTRIVWMTTIFQLWPVVETVNMVYPVSWGLNGIVVAIVYWVVIKRYDHPQNISVERRAG